MAQQAAEVLHSGVFGQLPGVKAANCRQHEIGLLSEDFVRDEVSNPYAPDGSALIPPQLLDLVRQLQVIVDPVLLRDPLPVAPYLGTLGELLTPLGIGRETRLVDMGWDVAPDARVDVLEPGASLL